MPGADRHGLSHPALRRRDPAARCPRSTASSAPPTCRHRRSRRAGRRPPRLGDRAPPGYLYDATTPRLLTASVPYAYVKIAEGCDMGCTFCAIPQFRGTPPEPPARRHRAPRSRGSPRAGCRRRSSSRRTRSPTGATCPAMATSATCCSRCRHAACRGSGRCTCIPPTSTTGSSSKWAHGARRARTSTCRCSTATTRS